MSKPVDLVLKQAFLDLQIKMVQARKKIQEIDSQINVRNRILHITDFSQREIDKLGADINTYESVGRMFLLTPLDDVKANFIKRKEKLTEQVAELNEKKEYLDKNLKESEDNIREMVQLRKGQIETKETKTN